MPYFLVSLLKSYSLNLRDLTLKPCSQVGALTLLSAARTKGMCGASRRPDRKHTRARRVICTRLDMMDLAEKRLRYQRRHLRPAMGRSTRAGLTSCWSVQS